MLIKKIRYHILKAVAKTITPSFYRVNMKPYLDKIEKPFLDGLEHPHRPAITNIIKNYAPFQNRPLKGAEIGVFYGANALNILGNLSIKKLYLVDIWEKYKQNNAYFDNTEAYEHVLELFRNNPLVEVLKGYSVDIAELFEARELDFVYIDGNHGYDYVLDDLEAWSSKVRYNGIIAGHDINYKSVFDALQDYCSSKEIDYFIEAPDWYFYNRGQ